MTWVVELSWREHGVYEVEADTEDDAISAAMIQAGRDSVYGADQFDVESVEEQGEDERCITT